MMPPEVIWTFDLNAGMPPLGIISNGKGPTTISSDIAPVFAWCSSSARMEESTEEQESLIGDCWMPLDNRQAGIVACFVTSF